MNNFLIGADPEVFVRKNGTPISAHGLIPGTKKEPHKTDYGAIQVDGMALEFNIDPTPSKDFDTFNLNIVKTLADLKSAAGEGHSLSVQPVQEFDPDYLKAQPEEAKELGCDPDFNAYTLAQNPRPDGERAFRTGAGHIHVGWGADIPVENEEHIEICAGFIKMLDATVGMFMTYIDRDPRRRELYGCAGAFRPKSYGVEYRTPSNVWIRNRGRRQMMHILINRAISSHCSGITPEQLTNISEEEIVRIINTGDWEVAEMIMDRLGNNRGQSTWRIWTAIRSEMEVVNSAEIPN